MSAGFELVLRPRSGWQPVDLRELWHSRELFVFLVWRDITIRYKQTVLGAAWAVMQPFFAMVMFTLIFHRLAGIASDDVPYPLFAYSGMAAWTFFAAAVGSSSNSLVANQQLIAKIYFPRLFIPLAAIGALTLDLLLSLAFMAGMIAYYRWPLSTAVLWLPVWILGAWLAASGTGLIFSAMNVSFRDVKYAVPFLIQMLFFATPVIYPMRYVPERYQPWLALNPMVGIVQGFRHSLLGTEPQWRLVGTSLAMCLGLFVVGLFVFRRMERRFADII
jgi:lipopolysaccharide transport system permease protein